jgi:ABC-type dipeptide/oligopeptide/nickel transport system permease subunit
MARLIRGQILSIKKEDFVMAAQSQRRQSRLDHP